MTTRSSVPWLIGGAVVVVAAVGTVVVLTTGDDGGGRAAAPPSTTVASDSPLGTPEDAAENFAAAAGTGSGDELLALACVGRPACVREHATGVSEAQLAAARDSIREGVFELAEHLKGAEFTAAVDGDVPGAKDVPYRTPAMTSDAYLTLTFVQSDGEWLYYRPTT